MIRLAAGLLLVTLSLALTSRASPPDEDEVELKLEEERTLPGPFANRTGANRARALAKYGASARVETAIEDDLRWLALHQAADGHWGLHDFNKHARTEPLGRGGKVVGDNSTPNTTRRNDTAGTAFGLLPFLAAGITHKAPAKKTAARYDRTVDAGLKWLLKKQSPRGNDVGYFGGDAYSHALATLAVCEAYGMTNDPRLKGPAQSGVDYLLRAQHNGGGWRYAPGQAGDTSVTSFVVRALAVARASGLRVPPRVFAKVGLYLDSAQTQQKGVYGYVPGSGGTPAMTAAGALCRQLLGVGRGDAGLAGSVSKIESVPPTAGAGIYYEYYATRVTFNVGGEHWKRWNLGAKGDGKGGMRDVLLARQDDGAKVAGDKGSWAGADHASGGRLGATSMSLLTLQVYSRYAPLHEQK